MDRWARGEELACSGRPGHSAGGCRNLATWLLLSDLWPGRNWMSCNLHLDSRRRLMIERHVARNPEIVPFQDITERPARRNKRPRCSTR